MIMGVVILVLIAGGLIFFLKGNSDKGPGEHDEFAKCLTESGTKMFGAFWCPHCNDQKEAFGNSWQYVDYIECSNKDRSQTQQCIDEDIQGYPTWEFKDGERQTGFVPLAVLSEKTGCELTPTA